jgi:hypothetical protein
MRNEQQKKSRKAWVQRLLAEDPDYFKKLGAKGGRSEVPTKGFGMMSLINPEKHRKTSSKGGKQSSRKTIDNN